MFELQSDVGILGGVLLHSLDTHLIHRELARATTNQSLDLDRAVIEVTLGQIVHIVTRLGIEQIVQDHRIDLLTTHLDSQTAEHHDVELHILRHLLNPLVLEQRAHNLGKLLGVLLRELHIPRLVRLYGERHSDYSIAEEVKTRSLGVEAELIVLAQSLDQSAELLARLDEMVGVRRRVNRLLLHQRKLTLSTLQIGLRMGYRGGLCNICCIDACNICFIFGWRSFCLSARRIGKHSEQIALTLQRLLASLSHSRACSIYQLMLWIGLCGIEILGRHILQITQKEREIELGIESLQIVVVWLADLQILGVELHRHIGADGRKAFREEQLLAPRLHLFALFTLDLLDVGQDILDRTKLAHELASTLLTDAWNTRDIVGLVAPDGQNIAHKLRVGDAILLANILLADDLHSVALLLVDVAVGANQLAIILVGRNHIDVVTCLLALHGQSTDHIVGLVARNLKNRDSHSLQ